VRKDIAGVDSADTAAAAVESTVGAADTAVDTEAHMGAGNKAPAYGTYTQAAV